MGDSIEGFRKVQDDNVKVQDDKVDLGTPINPAKQISEGQIDIDTTWVRSTPKSYASAEQPLWTSNGKKGSVKWRCEHAQSRGFLGNFVNLHSATS